MDTEVETTPQEEKKINVQLQNRSSDTVYAIGLIGAWVYYIGGATTPEEKIRGFFKAFAWPGILVYKLFKFLEQE
jgi:hypothetical protein